MSSSKDKKFHEQLKQINKQRNTIGVGGFKDSRRTRCEQNEKFNTALVEINKMQDESKMKEIEDNG